ncbi:MAG TPA: RidA family protein [Candidatus Thermoplasmatota archaeon]|nr:RidA family protein [Candidatus Thermoplasmatota archaeon]
MDPEAKLANMGITLPSPQKPFASYRSAVQSGKLLFVAGQGPTREGKILMTGKLGDSVDVKQGQEAARLSVINALAIVKQHAGSLANVKQVVRATIYVASTPTFVQQPQVADGATDLLKELWGEDGLPARVAVGVPVLPMDIPVEVELAFELR